MPNNFILIQTGLTLKEIDKIGVSPKAFVSLLALGFLALIPTFISKRYEKKYAEQQQYAPVSDKEEQWKYQARILTELRDCRHWFRLLLFREDFFLIS